MEDNAELESFRRQWREEVARRTKQSTTTANPQLKSSSTSSAPRQTRFPPTKHEASDRKEEEEEESAPLNHEIIQKVGQLSLGAADEDVFHKQLPQKEPSSALEHFETAVQKEAEGSLGDSLNHYRKAYRLDSSVDKTYRNKHFAHAWKPSQPPSTSTTTPATASQTAKPSEEETVILPTPELIASFASLPIPPAEPLIENTPPPQCPISNVPSDVLVEILRHVAVMDPASFCRMSLVCKRFAYYFAHEQHIWKRLCQGSEFGFKAMHYSFACDVYGNPTYTLGPRYTPFPRGVPLQIPKPLSTWSQVFQMFPRIRFTGIYISTVNYTRPGAASSYHNVSWNTPIHIVTYYRYLRFYPDGSVISLLTTTEPMEVVPHISKENMLAARATASSHRQHQRRTSDHGATLSGAPDPVPPVAMSALKHALRGRWQLTQPAPASDSPDADSKAEPASSLPLLPGKSESDPADPRDLLIETEGVDPKYIYTMHLSLRSSSSSKSAHPYITPPNPPKNTRLVWKGFWSYNKLTDDWAEFGLRNDRAFVFRRVRGWGMES